MPAMTLASSFLLSPAFFRQNDGRIVQRRFFTTRIVVCEVLFFMQQQFDEFRMYEQFLAPDLDLFQDPDIDQHLEVNRCRLAVPQLCGDEIFDTAVRLFEDELDEFTGIDLGRACAQVIRRVRHQFADSVDFHGRQARGSHFHMRSGRLCGGVKNFRGATAMTEITKTLSAEARKLSPAERIDLVDDILASLDEPDPNIDRQWAKEADDRLAAYRRGEIQAVPLEQVLAKYRAQ